MKKQIIDIVLPDLGEGIDGAEVSEVSVRLVIVSLMVTLSLY